MLVKEISSLPPDIVNDILSYCFRFCGRCQGWIPDTSPTHVCAVADCTRIYHRYVIRYHRDQYYQSMAGDSCQAFTDWKSCHECSGWWCPDHSESLTVCSAGKIHQDWPCHVGWFCVGCSGSCTCGNIGCTGRLCLHCSGYYRNMFQLQ
jgi:hypothetical protein